MERLPIAELDSFEADFRAAHGQLNGAEDDLQAYGDSTFLTGEKVVDVYDKARLAVVALTRTGIRSGYLTKELSEV